MTRKEQEALGHSMYDTPETACINMIDSIICYGGFGKTAEQILEGQEKAYHNYLEQYVEKLGREKVLELIQGQLDDIAYILENVGTDCEGLSYNSIVYRDEI